MDVKNRQRTEGLLTNVIMSAWHLPHRPFAFMLLINLKIGHNPISPGQGHSLAAHLQDWPVEFCCCCFLCAWTAGCFINLKTNECCEISYWKNTDFQVLLRNLKLSVVWPTFPANSSDWGMWVSRSPGCQEFASGCRHIPPPLPLPASVTCRTWHCCGLQSLFQEVSEMESDLKGSEGTPKSCNYIWSIIFG